MMNAVLFAGSRESLTARRLMRNSKFPEPPMISGLPEEKRKLAKEQVKKLASTLKECSSYAETGYATGKSNVVKMPRHDSNGRANANRSLDALNPRAHRFSGSASHLGGDASHYWSRLCPERQGQRLSGQRSHRNFRREVAGQTEECQQEGNDGHEDNGGWSGRFHDKRDLQHRGQRG